MLAAACAGERAPTGDDTPRAAPPAAAPAPVPPAPQEDPAPQEGPAPQDDPAPQDESAALRSDRLSISLDLVEAERSLDAHRNRYVIDVNDRDLRYRGPVGQSVRGRYRVGVRQRELTEAQRDAIAARVRRIGLSSDVRETRPTTDASVLVDVTAELTVDGQTAHVRLVGPMQVRREGARVLSNAAIADALVSLAHELKRIAGAGR